MKKMFTIGARHISELTIEDLRQGDKVLTISTISESNAEDQVTLNVKGDNQLRQISMLQSAEIRGSKDSSLSVSENIWTSRNLIINNATICTGQYKAWKMLTISGNSNITAKDMRGQILESQSARMKAKKIELNLAPGGILTIEDVETMLPLLAEKKLVLGKNSNIVIPKQGKIENPDSPYGPNCRMIVVAEGMEATKVVIQNTGEK